MVVFSTFKYLFHSLLLAWDFVEILGLPAITLIMKLSLAKSATLEDTSSKLSYTDN